MTDSRTFDVVVVGAGIAGLSAAVSAAACADGGLRIAVLERVDRARSGGNTAWTEAYLRLDDVYEVADGFVDDLVDFSASKTPRDYVETLVQKQPETMEWIQALGARFHKAPTYFVTSSKRRLQPVGGGPGLLDKLRAEAERLGVTFLYETTAERLHLDGGRVAGVEATTADGGDHVFAAPAVIIASGGFEGDTALLSKELGGDAERLIPIAPSVSHNRGEGIRMALAAGARASGEWGGFHAEPVDPRSSQPQALVMVYPYGILVNKRGERFVDEGAATVDESYEAVARAIWRQPDGVAYFIADQRLYDVPLYERGILTDQKPITAESIEQLEEKLALPAGSLVRTVRSFSEAVQDGPFDPRARDSKATAGITPPKSNWAQKLDAPPFLCYPVACAIVFTYGGIATDTSARVVDATGQPIAGLYAAGECTGIYYHRYPGGTSVLRGMVFGRLAGLNAAKSLLEARATNRQSTLVHRAQGR